MAMSLNAPLSGALGFEFLEPQLFLDPTKPGYFAIWRIDPIAGAERRAAMLAAGVDPRKVEKVTNGFQALYPLSQLERVIMQCQGKKDHFVSQLSFRLPRRRDGSPGVPNRKKRNAVNAAVCFLDFDISIRRDEVDEALRRLFLDVEDASVPMPSYAVFSGRGLHLKWLIDSIPRKALLRWDLVQRSLLQSFLDRHWAVDRRAIDRSRVLRIPGTYNAKSGALCEIVWMNRTSGGDLVRYGFDNFADQILPMPRHKYLAKVRAEYDARGRLWKEQKAAAAERYKQRGRQIAQEIATRTAAQKIPDASAHGNKHGDTANVRRLAFDRAADCRKLLELRSGISGFKSACREELIFWMVNFEALSGRTDSRQLAERAREIARELCPSDWADRHAGLWESHLSTLSERFGFWRSGDETKVYTPRNATLIANLAITNEEQKSLKTIISAQEKRVRLTSRRRAKGIVPRDEYLRQVQEDSLEAKAPWATAGISRATWWRRRAAAA